MGVHFNYVALASLDFNTDQWSTKNGIQQVAHVSTIDAITLSCLLIEKAANIIRA